MISFLIFGQSGTIADTLRESVAALGAVFRHVTEIFPAGESCSPAFRCHNGETYDGTQWLQEHGLVVLVIDADGKTASHPAGALTKHLTELDQPVPVVAISSNPSLRTDLIFAGCSEVLHHHSVLADPDGVLLDLVGRFG